MSKRFLACVLSLAMLLTTLSVPTFAAEADGTAVATVDGVEYTDLQTAVEAAKNGGTVNLVSDTSIDTWNQVWDVDGLTINGGNHTVTVNKIESNGNGDYMFYGAKKLTVSNLTIKLNGGSAAFSLGSGSLTNVTVEGGTYAVLTGGNAAPTGNASITIDGCTFKGQKMSIYTNENAAGYDLVVNNCTFDSNRPIIIRANEIFTNNTITASEKMTIDSGAAATITGNTFTEGSTLKLYDASNTKIEKNTLSKIEAGSNAKANLDGNYWGGSEPANLPAGVTATTYYTDEKMTNIAVSSSVTAKIDDVYYATVTEALKAAEPNAVVEVINTTAEAIAMPLKSVTLKGAEGVTLTGGIKFAGGAVPEGTAVTIENLTFDGRGIEMVAWTNTTNLKNFSSLTISNNTFKNVEVRNTDGTLESIYAIHINNADDAINGLTITENTFTDNRLGGISVGAACGTVSIINNTIKNSGMNAIQFAGKDSSGNAATSITIADNIISEWGPLGPKDGSDPEGRAMRLSNFADGTAVDLTGNVFACENAPEEYIKATGVLPEQLDLNECYWGGEEPTVGTGAGVNIWIVGANNAAQPYTAVTYYKDAEKNQLVSTANAVAKVGDTYYSDLLTAIKQAEAGATVTVLKDTAITEDPAAGAFISKSLTIEGNGHTITTDATRILRVDTNDVTLTLNNVILTGANAARGIQADSGVTGVTFNIDGCKISAKDYTINMVRDTQATIHIKNSELTGWGVLNLGGSLTGAGHTVSIENSVLNSINYKPTSKWDNFSALTLDRGVTNTTVDVTNTVIRCITEHGNNQWVFAINDGEGDNTIADLPKPDNNTITFTGCTFEMEGNLADGSPLVPQYKVVGGNQMVTVDGKKLYVPAESNIKLSLLLTPVAKIGDIHFGDLQTAIDTAKAGDTITLLEDVTTNRPFEVGGKDAETQPELTLNLDGHTLAMHTKATDAIGTVIQNYGKLTINGLSADGKAGKIVSAIGNGVVTWEDTALVINNTDIDAWLFAVSGNGSSSNVTINLDGVNAISRNGTGMYNPQDGTTTIKNSNISGASAIEIRAGSVIIENSILTATADEFLTQDHNSATTVLGAAIAVSQHTTNKPINLTVKSGTFTGIKAVYEKHHVKVDADKIPNAPITISLQGGSFNGAIESEHAEKFISGGAFKPAADEKYLVDGNVWYENNGAFYAIPAFTMKASADKKTYSAGDTVTVTVAASGAVNYTNADWKLRFDPTKLTLTDAQPLDGAVLSADNYVLSGKIGNVGSSKGDEIASGTTLATYTFTVVGQTTTPVTTAIEVLDAHVNTYDMAVQLTSVPAATENAEIEIIIDETNSVKGTLAVQTVEYDGKAHMANAFVPAEGMTGAAVTYSTTEDGEYTTALPSFTQVGSHDVWYRATLAGYQTTVAKAEGAVVIMPKEVTASVELAAGAAYPEIVIRPIINGIADRTFTGTITVGIDSKTFTFAATDFVYDGNGKAILAADKAQTVTLSRGGAFDVTAAYTAGTNDNYIGGEASITQINVDLAFADEATVEALTTALTSEFVYDGTAHGVTVADSLPDGWTVDSITAIDGTANPTVTNVADGSVFVQVIFADQNGRYNDVTINTVLAITPAQAVITIGDFAKDFDADDTSIIIKEGSTAVTVTGLIADGDLGTITAVRGELGEERGTYAMTASYTPNGNYAVTVINGKLEIGAPAYLVEVVDNALLHGGDHNSDYVAGYKLILVYTDADRSYFTYNGKQMYDVTENGYHYVDYSNGAATESDKAYRHVFGIVVQADGGDAADYRAKVRYTTDAAAQPERIVYDMDVNFDKIYDANDISAANGVYNALYADVYARNMLKADANADKYVDTKDVELVKARVEK